MRHWRFWETPDDGGEQAPPTAEDARELAQALERCRRLSLQGNRLVMFAQGLSSLPRATRGHYRRVTARLREACEAEERRVRVRTRIERCRGQFEEARDARLAHSARLCEGLLRRVEEALAAALEAEPGRLRALLDQCEAEVEGLQALLAQQAERMDHLTDAIHDVDVRTLSDPRSMEPLARVRLSAIEEAVLCDVTCPMEEIQRVTSSVREGGQEGDRGGAVGTESPARLAEKWEATRLRLQQALREATESLHGVAEGGAPASPPPMEAGALAARWRALRATVEPEPPSS